VNISETVAL